MQGEVVDSIPVDAQPVDNAPIIDGGSQTELPSLTITAKPVNWGQILVVGAVLFLLAAARRDHHRENLNYE